jgi:hypothetical protein
MQIIGCYLHARQQTLAMLDTTTGEVVEKTLTHEGNGVREFYPRFHARRAWGWKRRDRCTGSGPNGRAGHRMPGRPSGTDSRGRASEAKT